MAIFQTVVRVGYVEYELVTILTLYHKKSVNGNRNFGKMFYWVTLVARSNDCISA